MVLPEIMLASVWLRCGAGQLMWYTVFWSGVVGRAGWYGAGQGGSGRGGMGHGWGQGGMARVKLGRCGAYGVGWDGHAGHSNCSVTAVSSTCDAHCSEEHH